MPLSITIASGKGGVGKSIIVANIAYLLSSQGLKTLIWDADSFFPNQHLIFGIEPPLRLSQVYAGQISVNDAITKVKENLFMLADSPASGNFIKNSPTPILDLYHELLLEQDFDVILFDTPAGAADQLLQCIKISDIVAVMVTDEPTSLLDAYGLIKIFLKFIKKDKINLLVNNVIDYEDADEVSNKLNSATQKFLGFQLKQLGFIPYDRLVRLSIQKQEILAEKNPDADIVKYLRNLTDNIVKLTLNLN